MKEFWRIDVIDENEDTNGYSFCVSVDTKENEDSIIDICLSNRLLNRFDYKEYTINVENITNDQYEMSFWSDDAINI